MRPARGLRAALSRLIANARRLWAPLLVLGLSLAGCAPLPGPDRAGTFPLLQDGRAQPGVKRAIVAIPGAFASVNIFAPVLDWQVPDSAFIVYRFPDMDGLPLDHRVQIDGSAQLIADYVNDLGAEEVYLLGYSTGGPIAIETAQRLEAREVSLALISTAGPAPAGVMSSLRSGVEVVRAMLRSRSLRPRDAWTENYRTLLYGDEGLEDPARAQDSAARAEAQRANMSTPSLRRTLAHTLSLMTWTLDRPGVLSGTRVRLFHGDADTVFTPAMARRLAARLPADQITYYQGQGHLLFVTSRRLFDDIHAFFFDED
ncbi:alpha/beta fold hydrolase [Pseudooceanicola sp. 200-1SW]|uniref:alpha/beta fold hydrolase n=1 Tax=Pseudooceanicola sp. 200-1SW TaxID=3425949 RepID=UPI003D7F7A80